MVLCVLLIIATAITEIAPANLGYAAEEQQTNAAETESATNTTLAAPPSTLLEGTCEKQEVVYASMTATGAVKSLYVVNELFSEEPVMVKDFGTYSEESCDYPIYGEAVARAVADGEYERGILICGTGIGISISANKVKGIRAALCGDCYSAEMTRRHNDANILAMGARVLGPGLALKIVDTFLNTEFEGGRHARRIALISDIENRG